MALYDCRTPLGVAVVNGRMDALKLLLEHGASPNKIDGGYTALQRTIFCNYYDAIPLLLQYGGELSSIIHRKGDTLGYIFMYYLHTLPRHD